jgi:hypothetical protein
MLCRRRTARRLACPCCTAGTDDLPRDGERLAGHLWASKVVIALLRVILYGLGNGFVSGLVVSSPSRVRVVRAWVRLADRGLMLGAGRVLGWRARRGLLGNSRGGPGARWRIGPAARSPDAG